jgi:hypothetical protein
VTPAEYLEFVEEGLGFPESGEGKDPNLLLYCTREQCEALAAAHAEYCQKVEKILFPNGR